MWANIARKYKYALLLVILAVCLWFQWVLPAKASNFNQTSQDQNASSGAWYAQNLGSGQSFNWNNLKTYFGSSGTNTVYACIFSATSSLTSEAVGSIGCTGATRSIAWSYSDYSTTTINWINFDALQSYPSGGINNSATGTIVVNPSLYYYIFLASGPGYPDHVGEIKGTNNLNVFPTSTYCFYGINCIIPIENLKNIYLETTSGANTNDTVSITGISTGSPVPSSTLDFSQWFASFNLATFSSNAYLNINYGQSSSTFDFKDQIFIGEATSSADRTNGVIDIIKTNVVSTGHYYAQANIVNSYVCGINPNTGLSLFCEQGIATSSIVEFDLTSTGNPFYLNFAPTSTLPELQVTCDPNSGFFQNSFCKMLVYLFVPGTSSFDKFSGLISAVKTKPPFGYFTALKTKLDLLVVGTSTEAMINASTATAFAPIYSPVRTGLAWAFWLLYVFWLLHRIRHLEL